MDVKHTRRMLSHMGIITLIVALAASLLLVVPAAADDCPPGHVLVDDVTGQTCMHYDPVPPGYEQPPATTGPRAASVHDVGCAGDGPWTVRAVHVTTDTTRRTAADAHEQIRRNAAAVTALMREQSGGANEPRWATDEDCRLLIREVASEDGTTDYGAVTRPVHDAGYVHERGRQVAWVDGTLPRYCGLAPVPRTDPIGEDLTLSVVYCWGARTVAHELLHTLGAVHRNAPHADGHHYQAGAGQDVMCSGDVCSGGPPECTRYTLDCQGGSYWQPDHQPDTWLGEHPKWNAAASPWLQADANNVPEPPDDDGSDDELADPPVVPPPPPPVPPRFADTAGHEHEAAIARLAELGVVEGFGDGTFGPQDRLTRAQAAAMFDRMIDHLEATQ